ncbi:MAG: 2-hydroxyglutaryl-CoA dehydratase, partial [Desulfobacterales bacterium CG23_combo_of_CG06-09_8_20_14_all_51_8]
MKGLMKTESGRRLTQILTDDYMNLHGKASKGAFVVWVAIIVPIELFKGFDNVVFAVPESHAALSAAKGVGMLQCEKAEHSGYSMDICSYARIDIGTAMSGGKDSPTFGLPRPNLLVADNNNCSLLVKWFDVYHREWGVPHFILDVPFCYEMQKETDLKYIVAQFRDLIRTIE